MFEIQVNTDLLKQYASRLNKVNNRVIKLNYRIKSLYSKVGLLGLFNLIQADVLTRYNTRIVSATNYLNQTAADFEGVENYLNKLNPTDFNITTAIIGQFFNSETDKKRNPFDFIKNLQKVLRGIYNTSQQSSSESVWDKFMDGKLKTKKEGYIYGNVSEDNEDDFLKILVGMASASFLPKYGEYEDEKAFNDRINEFLKSKGKNELPKQKKHPGKQINKDEEFYKKKGTIFEAKGEIKAEGSVVDYKNTGNSKNTEYSVEGKVLTGEAYAKAAGGFYVYEKDKDGNTKRIFSPGVNAEVGASVSVLEGKAEGRVGLGKDKQALGAYGEVEAKALTAEGKAKFAANKNEVFAGASAEADLIKATAKGGVSVLGTDVGVTGSVKIGVGAHANVGYTDRKLKVDLGAAVGVGVDIGFEVDVGGTVDAVCDGAKAAWKGVKGFFSGVF